MKSIMTDRDVKTLAKVVVDAQSDLVLGFHMVGEHASEILQVFPS
jgi:pyruvate/2-oxoglutarate dehydrogenase complex dihydrolipoamide dehydrogenase (E3) component